MVDLDSGSRSTGSRYYPTLPAERGDVKEGLLRLTYMQKYKPSVTMMDDQSTNILLIEIIEKFPELWNYGHKKYSRKHYIEKKWHDIAKIKNDTAQNCKVRWNSIRGCYDRYLKDFQYGSTSTNKKEYYLAPFLTFLMPLMNNCTTSENIPRLQDDTVECTEITGELSKEEAMHSSQNAQVIELHQTRNVPDDMLNQLFVSDREKENKKRVMESRIKKKEGTYLKQSVMDYLTLQMSKTKVQLEDGHEADKNFLLSLLPDLIQLKGHNKNEFKVQVIQMMDKLIYGNM